MTCKKYYLVRNQIVEGCNKPIPFKVMSNVKYPYPLTYVPKYRSTSFFNTKPILGAPIIRFSPYRRQNYPVRIEVASNKLAFNILVPYGVSRYIVSEIYRQKALGVTGDVVYRIELPQYKLITYGSYDSLVNLLENIKSFGAPYPSFEDTNRNKLKLDDLIEKAKTL